MKQVLPVSSDQRAWMREVARNVNRPRLRGVRSVGAATTLLDGDELVEVTASVTVTLPPFSSGRAYTIIKTYAGGTVTISGGGTNINGAASIAITAQYGARTIEGGVSEWRLVASV